MVGADKTYVQVVLAKSAEKLTIKRNFNKLDNYLSYVGGLIGTIIVIFITMSFYTEKAYEISIGKKILLDDDSQ